MANNAVITAASVIGLTWTADYNGGSPILDYKVYFDQGTNTWTPFAFGITQTSFTATGLTAGTTYKFKVQARNIVGYSAISSEISVIAAAYPSSPTDLLNVPAITDASNIGLRWTATYSGGSAVIDYRVSYDQATGVWVQYQAGITSTSLTVTSLTNNQNYSFKVEARNSVGYSNPSIPVTILSARIPDAPLTVVNRPSITQAGSIGLQWTANYNGGSPILSYRVFYD